MLLSIILPIYNVENYLEDCLNSIVHEVMPHKELVEIVCVDDGSTDNSFSIVKRFSTEYKELNFVVISQRNGGASRARNEGIKQAKGNYFWLVDSDDIILGGCLNYILPFLDGTIEMVSGQLSTCRETYNYHGEIVKKHYCGDNRCHVTTIVLKKLITDHDLFYKETLSFGEDLLFFELLSCYAKKVRNLDIIIYLYRNRSTSAMHTIDEKYLDCLFQRIDYYNYYLQIIPENKRKYLIDRRSEVIRNIIFNAVLNSKDILRERLCYFQSCGLYPYPLLWSDLYVFHNIKDFLIKLFCFLFPIKSYSLSVATIVSVIKSIK